MKKLLFFISTLFIAVNVHADRIDIQDFTLTYIADTTFQGMEYQKYEVRLPGVYSRSYSWTYEYQTNKAVTDGKAYSADECLNTANNNIGRYPVQLYDAYSKKLTKTDVDTFCIAKDQDGLAYLTVCVYSRYGLEAYMLGATTHCPKVIGATATNELTGPVEGARKDLYDAIVEADDYTYEIEFAYTCSKLEYSVRHAQNLYEKYLTATVTDQEVQDEIARLKAAFEKSHTTTLMQLNADYDVIVSFHLQEIATGKKYEYIDLGKTIKTRVNSNNKVDVTFPALDFGNVTMGEKVVSDCDTILRKELNTTSVIQLNVPYSQELTVNGEKVTCTIGSELSYVMGDEGIISSYLFDEYMYSSQQSPNKYTLYISYNNQPFSKFETAQWFVESILADWTEVSSKEATELLEAYNKYGSYNCGYDDDLLIAAAQDLVNKIHNYQAAVATNITDVTNNGNSYRQARKYISNGRICISNYGNTYNIAGQRIK